MLKICYASRGIPERIVYSNGDKTVGIKNKLEE